MYTDTQRKNYVIRSAKHLIEAVSKLKPGIFSKDEEMDLGFIINDLNQIIEKIEMKDYEILQTNSSQ